MPRIARVVVPGTPHHITQRGNRRQTTFFHEADYDRYIDLMAKWTHIFHVEIWAYCLMPNHIHLIAVPPSRSALTSAVAEAHRRYSLFINSRENWRGHLWQGRYASYPMDEPHVFRCARYIEMNPVRSGLVKRPDQWKYSSARAHIFGTDDKLVKTRPLLQMAPQWLSFLLDDTDEDIRFRQNETTGRPMGTSGFISTIETILNRKLTKQKPGPRRSVLADYPQSNDSA